MSPLNKVLFAALLAGLLLLGARAGCAAIGTAETGRILDEVEGVLLPAAAGLEPAIQERLESGLRRARDLAEAGQLSPIARDTLRNRSEAVLADGALHPREAEHLLRLLEVLSNWRDEVHALEFTGQR